MIAAGQPGRQGYINLTNDCSMMAKGCAVLSILRNVRMWWKLRRLQKKIRRMQSEKYRADLQVRLDGHHNGRCANVPVYGVSEEELSAAAIEAIIGKDVL